jgi:hypothetical protein
VYSKSAVIFSPQKEGGMGKLKVGLARLLPLAVVILLLPSIAAT